MKILFLSAIIILFSQLTVYTSETIEILVPDYQPFAGVDADSTLWGDLIRAAFKTEDIAVTYKSYPLERMKIMVKNGSKLALINTRLIIKEDEKGELLTGAEPFIYADVVAFYLKRNFPDNLSILHAGDLKGQVTGALRGTGSITVLTAAQINPLIIDSSDSLLRMLGSSRIQFAVISDLTGISAINHTMKERLNEFAYQSIYRSPIDLIFSKKHPQSQTMLVKFQTGLKKIKKNGTYLTIAKKFYPPGRLNKNILPDDL